MRRVAELSLGRRAAERLTAHGLEDGALPLLPSFRDVPAAAAWCRAHLAATTGLVPGSVAAVRTLRYRAGRRCTLRLEFGEGAIRRLYVKLFRPGRFRGVVRRLGLLPATAPVGLCWPRTVRALESDGALVLDDVPGHSLEGLVAAGGEATSVGGRVGAAIAQFHALIPAERDDRPPWTIQDEASTLTKFQPRLLELGTDLPRSVDCLLEQARQSLNHVSFSAPVLLHRDLHPQQILLGEAVGVVDLDNLAVGPPEIDLGNLIAHIDLFALHLGQGVEEFKVWRGSVLASYRVHRPLDLAAVQAVRVVTLVRLAGVYAGATHLPSLAGRLLEQAERFMAREVAA